MPEFSYTQGNIVNGSIWDTPSTTQKNPLGRRLQIGERVFRYVKVTTAMTAWSGSDRGNLMSIDKDEADLVAIDSSTSEFGDGTLDAIAGEGGTAGDHAVRIYGATISTIDRFAGGYLHVTDGAGEGYTYGVKSHPVITSSTSGLFELFDPIQVAVDGATTGTSKGVLQQNLFADVEQSTAGNFAADLSQVVVGAAVVPFGTVNTYGWIQTWGPIGLRAGAASVTQGDVLYLAEDNHGCIQTAVAGEEHIQTIGVAMADSSDEVWIPCYLQIMP